jgi:hypothetical protein
MVLWEDGSRQSAVDAVVGKLGRVGGYDAVNIFVLVEQWQLCSKLALRLTNGDGTSV